MSKSSQIGMIVYPGSNCDQDCTRVFKEKFNLELHKIWHQEKTIPNHIKGLIIPGGFSYGDYLRSGSLAALSPIMPAVVEHAAKGGAILGICNGFQILTESRLLPGTLLANNSNKFICEDAKLRPISSHAIWNQSLGDQDINLPIAHKEGRYYIDAKGLENLQENKQILLRYHGNNPNGSVFDIAGVCSENGKVQGMMPHPERASLQGYHKATHGLLVFENFLAHTL